MEENAKLGVTVIYDMAMCPRYVTLDEVFNIMKNGGILIYDSSLAPVGTSVPQVLTKELKMTNVAFWPKEYFEERFDELKKEPKNPFFSYKAKGDKSLE